MNLFLSLLCLSIVMVHALPLEEGHQLLKTADLLDNLKQGLSTLDLNGKKLTLKYYGNEASKPVYVADDFRVEYLNKQSNHDLYHDEDNDATFTVSTFVDQDGKEVKHVRGTILEDGHEVVVEPHVSSVEKRSVEDENEHVRIYKRQIVGKRPVERVAPYVIQKRQTTSPVNAYVEVLAVCDLSCFNQHAAYAKTTVKEVVAHHVEGYLAHIMNLADLHYQRTFATDTQLKIGLYTKSYVILTTAAASKFTTDASVLMTVNGKSKDATNRQYVNGDVSLNLFNTWLSEQLDGNTIPTFDLAVAFVNSNLFTPSSDLLGIAPMSGACIKGRNGVLVEDSGDFGSGSTTAHEVAHNLAVEHDVKANSAACTDEANYVMSTSNKFENRVNSFFFSACSIASLKNSFVTTKKFPCTANVAYKSSDFLKFTNFKPGQLLTADEQCKRALGSTSKLMLGNKAGGGSFEGDMCKVLWCTTDYQSASANGYATEHTSCGDGKWCVRGSCVADASAPKGQCLVEDDTAFCNDFLSKYGMTNVCNNFKSGRCCKMCGGSLIPRLGAHDVDTFLRGNALDDVKFLSSVYTPPCQDVTSWDCPTLISNWIKSYPDICNGNYEVNSQKITTVCRKTCNKC